VSDGLDCLGIQAGHYKLEAKKSPENQGSKKRRNKVLPRRKTNHKGVFKLGNTYKATWVPKNKINKNNKLNQLVIMCVKYSDDFWQI